MSALGRVIGGARDGDPSAPRRRRAGGNARRHTWAGRMGRPTTSTCSRPATGSSFSPSSRVYDRDRRTRAARPRRASRRPSAPGRERCIRASRGGGHGPGSRRRGGCASASARRRLRARHAVRASGPTRRPGRAPRRAARHDHARPSRGGDCPRRWQTTGGVALPRHRRREARVADAPRHRHERGRPSVRRDHRRHRLRRAFRARCPRARRGQQRDRSVPEPATSSTRRPWPRPPSS